jgi:tRNA (guanine37-N1)-methyltransferase
MKVPDILLSGNHKLIEEWRNKETLRRTLLRRPDLFEKVELTPEQQKWLEEVKKEYK